MSYRNPRRDQHNNQEICPFYMRTGACKYGDNCSRRHPKPMRSCSVLFKRMYMDPAYLKRGKMLWDNRDQQNDDRREEYQANERIDDEKSKKDFENFFKDVFTTLSLSYGAISDMAVSGNMNKLFNGNVYVKFEDELAASRCYLDCNRRWYGGRPIFCELCPVTNFDSAACNAIDDEHCQRGSMCKFLHFRQLDPKLERQLYASQWKHYHAEETPDSGVVTKPAKTA